MSTSASVMPRKEVAEGQWVCLAEDIPSAIYYSMRFPLRYASMRGQVL